METNVHLDPTKRHDFVVLFEVSDGNPNGDPDAGNLPRVDPETMKGLVTDVSIKRKIRDRVDVEHGHKERYKIYIQNSGVALNAKNKRAYTELGIKPTGAKQKREDVMRTRAWMCENFYDIRTFGAVMTTDVNCGQVRGPVQLTFARSIDPIAPLDHSITRVAITEEKDIEVVESDRGPEGGKTTMMGRKATVSYALYRGFGYFTPHFAQDTGFSREDLEVFWHALENAWNFGQSASRGVQAIRGLYVFTHDNPLGNEHAHRLFERIRVTRRPGVEAPRSFGDYVVTVDEGAMPAGVTLTRLVDESRVTVGAMAAERSY